MNKLKLLNLDPVTYVSTAEELEYMTRFLGEDTVLETRAVTNGPATIENARDEALAAPGVIEACIQAEKDGYHGVFVNCFADPGVHPARTCVNIPVFGGFEPVMLTAMGTGHRIGIITVTPQVLTMLNDIVAKEGLGSRVACVRSVGIPVQELRDLERLCAALKKEALAAVYEQGAQVIVLGCTAMIGVAERLRELLKQEACPVPVLEAAQCGIAMLEMYAKMGLSHSRLTYMPSYD